jgi:cyclopropane-fatty-acyl-phospholipid synthase
MHDLETTCPDTNTSFARSLILKLLSRIQFGKITLVEEGVEQTYIGQVKSELHSVVRVHNNRLFKKLLFSGTLGAAESYIAGEWETDNLTHLIEIILKNKKIFEGFDNKFTTFINSCFNVLARLRKNNKKTAKKNILAHYDLGNDFFQLFLDKNMMYSCAVYTNLNDSLDTAALHKLALIANALRLNSQDHILEIGTGWGGFAIYAAQKWGCKVTTTTISDRQYNFVKDKIHKLNLQNQIEVLNKDYRELNGKYDKLVSIEMLEAVGHQYFKTFFKKCDTLVKPGGLLFLQAITIHDQLYHKAKNEMDFIKKYIFPGGCLPSAEIIHTVIATQTTMQLMEWRDIGVQYVKTLMDWRARFFANMNDIKMLNFPEGFIRTWDFYFCYCAAGFAQNNISSVQALWCKRL